MYLYRKCWYPFSTIKNFALWKLAIWAWTALSLRAFEKIGASFLWMWCWWAPGSWNNATCRESFQTKFKRFHTVRIVDLKCNFLVFFIPICFELPGFTTIQLISCVCGLFYYIFPRMAYPIVLTCNRCRCDVFLTAVNNCCILLFEQIQCIR